MKQSLSKENENKLKDIEFLKEDYENEGKEINSPVENVKKLFRIEQIYDLLDYIKICMNIFQIIRKK